MTKPFFSTPSPAAQKLEALRQLFPQAVEVDDKGGVRVNPAAIQMALDPANPAGVRVEEDGYELRWVGKREAYHQAFVPTHKIVSAAHSQSKDWDNTGNLLIKGDNLDALKLLRQSYFGQVKLIYIDPPYNTQSDQFIYRDDFSVKQTEVLTSLGYSAENIDYIQNIYGARTHSGWLSFMYPRLLLARDLLREDGVIFISIDDNEQAQLKLLCDEVFGADNFVAKISRESIKGGSKSSHFRNVTDFVICYGKEISNFETGGIELDGITLNLVDEFGPYAKGRELNKWGAGSQRQDAPGMFFPISGPNGEDVYPIRNDGSEGRWRLGKRSLLPMIPHDVIFEARGNGTYTVYEKIRESNPRIKQFTTLFKDNYINARGTESIKKIFDTERAIFSFPKPVELIYDLIISGLDEEEGIILDFFAGSGTTAEAVMRLNAEDGGKRQFILVQIPQPIDPVKQKEAHTFVTQTLSRPEATIFEITAERIRRAGAKLQAEQAAKRQAQGELLADDTPPLDTGFRVFELVDDPLGLVHGQALKDANQDQLRELQKRIATPQMDDLERVLSNLLLAEGLPLTTRIHTLVPEHLFVAHNVALLLQALPLDDLLAHLQTLKTAETPLLYLSVYAPWVQDDNLLLGLDALMDKLGLAKDKLRLRG